MRSVRQNRGKIRRLREQLELTQEQLASRIRYDVKTISRAETRPRIALKTLCQIANALGVTTLALQIPDILGGDDPTQWLDWAITQDEAGHSIDAIEVGTAIVDQLPETHSVYADAVVRLATFYDHTGSFESALQTLEKLHLSPIIGKAPERLTVRFSGTPIWGYYQRGLISRDSPKICCKGPMADAQVALKNS